MTRTPPSAPAADDRVALPAPLAAVIFAGALSALAGGLWDDAWHTERGRDEFFIAPHIAIYAGIATAGAAASLWALLAARAAGWRSALAHKPLALALLSVAATMASGPIDNFWHVAFGRDAVIWSPPHMLGIAGTLALGAAVLSELGRRGESWARAGALAAGALVLSAACFAVVEYETDVPQFSDAWYLPVLAFASAIGLRLARLAQPAPWTATATALLYTGFIGVMSLFLTALDFETPALPLVVAPALALDLTTRRAWPIWSSAAAFVVTLFAVGVALRNATGEGFALSLSDVLIGMPIAWIAVAVVFALTSRHRSSRGALGVVTALLLLAVPTTALAHDPGQGEDAGAVAMRVAAEGGAAAVTATLPPALCKSAQPRGVLARRAGETARGPLEGSGCRLQGRVSLPVGGRWFVYLELERGSETVEAWLPVSSRREPTVIEDRARFAYVASRREAGVIKWVLGAALYAGMALLLVATFKLVRPSAA